jgi:NAD(P)-dependent dehydrogenase (short-subunit alcohol dehydrogenase family)
VIEMTAKSETINLKGETAVVTGAAREIGQLSVSR